MKTPSQSIPRMSLPIHSSARGQGGLWLGAIIGCGLGAVSGYAVGSRWGAAHKSRNAKASKQQEEAQQKNALIGAVVGGILGGVLGSSLMRSGHSIAAETLAVDAGLTGVESLIAPAGETIFAGESMFAAAGAAAVSMFS